MARPLSCILLKGIVGLPAVRSTRTLFGSLNCYGMRYSTTSPSDPDTHEDFRPNNKLEGSGIYLKDIVEQDVKDNPVMIYMKGVPDLPQCGFSSLAVRVLKHYMSTMNSGESIKMTGIISVANGKDGSLLINVPLSARNILEDPELKSAVKSFSNWPTFPQIFIKGEFIGGSDIIMNMHQSGELKEKLQDVAAIQKSEYFPH